MKIQINLNSTINAMFLVILFLLTGIEQSSAAEITQIAINESFSLKMWLLVGLALAAFGFTTKSKS